MNLIIPDGYAVIKMNLHTTGQNADAQIYPILTRLGMGVLNGDFEPGDGDDTSAKSEQLEKLETLAGMPQGINTNLNFIADPTIKNGMRNADGDAPCLGIGVQKWLTDYYKQQTGMIAKGINTVAKSEQGTVISQDNKEWSVGIGVYPDVNPNNFQRQLYGILLPQVNRNDTVTIGTNIFNVLGSNDNGVIYFAYELPDSGTYAISDNVSGTPFLGWANWPVHSI